MVKVILFVASVWVTLGGALGEAHGDSAGAPPDALGIGVQDWEGSVMPGSVLDGKTDGFMANTELEGGAQRSGDCCISGQAERLCGARCKEL